MTLDQIKKHDTVRIESIEDMTARNQGIRFGLIKGAKVVCVEKLPAGPIVIKIGMQEIAIGRQLAKTIVISSEK